MLQGLLFALVIGSASSIKYDSFLRNSKDLTINERLYLESNGNLVDESPFNAFIQLAANARDDNDYVQGRIELNGKMTDVDCDCSSTWKEDMLNVKMEECGKPTKFRIQRIDAFDKTKEQINVMSASDVREFLGLPSALEYTNVDLSVLKDIDGRINEGILGTPGGDAGEFISALSVYSSLLGVDLDGDLVRDIFTSYIKHFGPRAFYFHSSADAVASLQTELNAETLDLMAPRTEPKELKETLLGTCPSNLSPPCGLVSLNNIGDTHVKLMMKYPGLYLVEEKTISLFIQTFFSLLWDGEKEVKDLLVFESLPPSHLSNEKAVINIIVTESCKNAKSVPLIKPRNTATSVFINHQDAVEIRRKELATYFSGLSGDLIPIETMFARLQTHGLRSFEHTIERVAKGLPIYNVFIE